LDGGQADAEGETRFLEILQKDVVLGVNLDGVRPDNVAGAIWFDFTLTNQSRRTLELRGAVASDSAQAEFGPTQPLASGQFSRLSLKGAIAEPGRQSLRLLIQESSGGTLFAGKTEFLLDWLDDSRPGYRLNGAKDLDVWW